MIIRTINIKDGVHISSDLTIYIKSNGKYNQKEIDNESKKLSKFLNDNVSSGFIKSLIDNLIVSKIE